MINPVHIPTQPSAPEFASLRPAAPVRPPSAGNDASFAQVLQDRMQESAAVLVENRPVRFSAHALQRLNDRGIQLDEADAARLSQAVDQAAAKGARESLVLMDRLAFVVSVPNRTVITAMPQGEAAHTVFTNIDSAVLVADEAAAA